MVLVVSDGLLGDKVPPQPGHADDGHDPDGVEGGDESKEDEPEPESDVNLLVDDVEGKNAEAVFPLDSSRRTELVESTFCDLGEMKIVMNLCLFNVTFGKTAAMGSYLSS